MPQKMIALIDANNFYVSCERVFNPSLRKKPVLILSNNDGIVISRSNEVKNLGITMGMPFFKAQHIIQKNNVEVFSSNYELYGDMSHRMIDTLSDMTEGVEIYSIDELFSVVPSFSAAERILWGNDIQNTVFKNTGIPVSVGIAPTKTLAKIACEIGKKNSDTHGVFDISHVSDIDGILKSIPVSDVWGVGQRSVDKLRLYGIFTALDLKNADSHVLRERYGVILQRTAMELSGVSCIALEEVSHHKKSIVCSRSFSKNIQKFSFLREKVSIFAARAAEKLRAEGSTASLVSVFLQTNRYSGGQQYAPFLSEPLVPSSSSSSDIILVALQILKKIYLSHCTYKKAGIMLSGFCPNTQWQPPLFGVTEKEKKKKDVFMKTVDSINNIFGKGSASFFAEGTGSKQETIRKYCSPLYTTHWQDIPIVKAQ